MEFFFLLWQVQFPDIATTEKTDEAQDYKTFAETGSHVKNSQIKAVSIAVLTDSAQTIILDTAELFAYAGVFQ